MTFAFSPLPAAGAFRRTRPAEGGRRFCPLPNSIISGGTGSGEAALESSQRVLCKETLQSFLKGQNLCQSQV